jgi:hypothetical protein
MLNLCCKFECTIRGTKVVKHSFYSIRTKMMFGSISEHFANLRHVKRWKLVFQAWMHYFGAPKLRSIHSTPLDAKWCLGALWSTSLTLCTQKDKTCVLGLNALFRGTKVAKHPFNSIWPKIIYWRAMEHFANLGHVKIWKLVFRA